MYRGSHSVILRRAKFALSRENKVAVNDIVPGPADRLDSTLASVGPDLLREMIKGFAQRMMGTRASICAGRSTGGQVPTGELYSRYVRRE